MKSPKYLIIGFLLLTALKVLAQNTMQIPEVTQVSSTPMSASPSMAESPPKNPSTMDLTASSSGLSNRDPFRIPEYLLIKIRQKQAVAVTSSEVVIDENVETIRRWPLASYKLVGIIWDVKRPKAMFIDEKNSIHLLKVNDFIGNAKGVITHIQNGSVTVQEGKIPQVIKLNK